MSYAVSDYHGVHYGIAHTVDIRDVGMRCDISDVIGIAKYTK